jgi:hypothetical protein
MTMEESKGSKSSDYFGTFLETVQSGQHAGTGPQPSSKPLWTDPLSMRLVEILKEDGPHATTSLQEKLGADLLTFSKSLGTMTEARFVELRGEAGHETVALTDEGDMLARVYKAQAER